MYLCACVRNRMTVYIFSENSKAITKASARTYTQPWINKEQSYHLRTPRTQHRRGVMTGRIPILTILYNSLKYYFHSFHFVTLKIQALLPSETSVAIYQPTWRYISKELKLNKHYGERFTIYMQRLSHVNDGLGLSQLSIQSGDLCADS